MATNTKFVDYDGLKYFAGKVKNEIGSTNTALENYQTNTGKAIDEVKSIAETARDTQFATINSKPLKGVSANYSLADLGLDLDRDVAIIVMEKPALAEAQYNKIYLVHNDNGKGDNTYTEWIKINDGKTDKWEELGEWQGGLSVSGTVAESDTNPVSGNAVFNAIKEVKEANTSLSNTIATADKLGLIKVGATSGQSYGVNVNPTTGAATVNVPWTDRKVYLSAAPNKTVSLIGTSATAAGNVAEGVLFSDVTYNAISHTLKVGNGDAAPGFIDAARFTGTANAAINDGAGNVIATTYVKGTDFDTKFTDAADRLLTTLKNSDIDTLWNEAKVQ